MSHSFNIDKINGLSVLRDDLLPGGTKRRGLEILLKNISSQRIFYAGTTMGHGALALACACDALQKRAEIFISGVDDDPMIRKLRNTNAVIHMKSPLPIDSLYGLAMDAAADNTVLPPGFDIPEFTDALVQSFQNFDAAPYSEIWTVSVTGTLTRALKRAFPDKTFKTVSVVKSGTGDFHAPEKYHHAAKFLPPYPSCPHTDAKVWQFVEKHASPDALVWNTAG